MNQNQHINQQQFEEENSIDIRKWIVKILSIWYIFAISIIACGIGCYYYNRTITPLFKTSTTVLIEEVKQQSMMGAQAVMQDFGVGAYRNVNNQIVLLSSYSMVERTVKKLALEVDYHYEEKFRQYPFYKNSPIEAIFENTEVLPSDVSFSVSDMGNNICLLNFKGNDIIPSFTRKVGYGQKSIIADFAVTINKTPYYDEEMPQVFFRHRTYGSLIAEFSGRMAIDFVMDEATIVEVSLVGANAGRDVDFLNTLTQEFLSDNLERKNREAIRTIDFITDQLNEVANSLAINENSLQDYRSQNNVININMQTNAIIGKANVLESEKATLLIKRDYYNYLIDYLNENDNDAIISPSTLGLEDPVVSGYIKQFAEFQFQKQMLAPKAPYHRVIDEKLKKVKASLVEATTNAIENTNISILDITNQISKVQELTEELPAKERNLLGIQRQLAVNDSYYTYLLQKRSEAEIQQASNSPDNTLIDIARVLDRTNRQKSRLNYIIALLLGGGLPLMFIVLAEVINNKVKTREDIEALTNISILGSIPRIKSDEKIQTITRPRSTFTESFRELRTRLVFMQGTKKTNSIMLTSAVSGEGKTFVAINLAGIFAISGKKTVLVGYDMRKPKIAQYLGKEEKHGLSNYLAGHDTLDSIIYNHEKNLDIIFSGTIPPNPGELVADKEKNEELFAELEKRYDYIIVDSTPVGVVADAFMTGQHVDRVLFVAKHDFTHKNIFSECLNKLKQNNIEADGVIANNISIKKSTYRYGRYIYGQNYGYGYGYGYGYSDTSQKGYHEE